MTSPTIDSSGQNPDDTNDGEIENVVSEKPQEQQPDEQQSPKTLTLDSSSIPDPPEIPDQNDPPAVIGSDETDQDEITMQDDPDSVTVVSPPPLTEDSHATTAAATTSVKRNLGKKKRKKMNKLEKVRVQQKKKWEKKVEVLLENFKPVPFVPAKRLDFARHEALLRRLGLWNFVHMEFDSEMRTDLVAQLIASFSPKERWSCVNGTRVKVSRADLARALQLPVKNARGNSSNSTEIVSIEGEDIDNESKRFLEDFLSTYVLLHEDTWMMPSEIINWTNLVKEGKFDKVDWAGMIWFMVERELKEPYIEPETSYYASHMQSLIKFQRKGLLADETHAETNMKEEDDDVKINDGDAEDLIVEISEPNLEDVKVEETKMDDFKVETDDTMMDLDDLKKTEDENVVAEDLQLEIKAETNNVQEEEIGGMKMEPEKLLEEHSIELSLGGTNNAPDELVMEKRLKENAFAGDHHNEDAMEFEECKEQDEEQGVTHRQWLFGDRSNQGDGFLQRCNLGLSEFEEERKIQEDDEGRQEENEEELEDSGFHIPPKGDNLDGMTSANLISRMEDEQIPFGSTGLQIRDNLPGDFLTGNSSVFGNGNKRTIEHDNDLSHDSFDGNNNKRVRTQSPWNEKSADASGVLDQAQYFIGKARNMVAEKEQALEELNMNQQILLSEIHARDSMIEQLQKAKLEEQHKRNMEFYRLDNELCTMGKLLDSYRKALKETQRAFSEYREKCPVLHEPLYKDVPNSGGFVLSVMEIERLRVKREEEDKINRLSFEKKLKEFEDEGIIKFDEFENRLDLHNSRLLNAEKEVKLIKEIFAKNRKSDEPEPKPEPEPEPELEPQPEPKLEPQPEPKLEPQPEPELEPKSECAVPEDA